MNTIMCITLASFYDMNELVEICPNPGSVYILSRSEQFNEEMEIIYDKFINWINNYGIPLYYIHASGHALPHHLKQTIAKIAPEKVFLVHTENPELYKRYLGDLNIDMVICPEKGKEEPI